MIRNVLSLLFSVLLVACNTPGPAFRGLHATRVTVGGSVFDVRWQGLQAEATRINPQYAPRFGPVRARAAQAMALATGCSVSDVAGDQALATGVLDCGKGPPKRGPPPGTLECLPVKGSEILGWGEVQVDLDCYPARAVNVLRTSGGRPLWLVAFG